MREKTKPRTRSRRKQAELASEALYLDIRLRSGDKAAFLDALFELAQARGGIASLSRETAIDRVNIYRMLLGSKNPKIESISKILEALGLRLSVVPAGRQQRYSHGDLISKN